MIPMNSYPASSVVPIFFATYGKTNGESITLTGLAVTDIEIYKGTSMTQRASDAGYALIDTDGIDVDGITGIHGFSVDLGDNTDAGFYAVGSFYTVVVSAVTVDGQTVNFIADRFRIVAAEAVSGKPKVDVDAWLGTAAATPTVAGVPEVDVTHWLGTAAATPTVAGVPEVDVTHFGGTAATAASGRPEVNTSHIAGAAVSTSAAQIGVNVVNAAGIGWGAGAIIPASIATGAIEPAKFAPGAITAAAFATNAIDANALAADAVTEIQSGLSTLTAPGVRTAVGLAAANLDTQLSGIQADTDDIQTRLPAALGANGNIKADIRDALGTALAVPTVAGIPKTEASGGSIASVSGAVGSVTGAVGSVTGAVGSVTGAVGSVTGGVGGNVTGSVGSLATQAKADVNAEVVDCLNVDTYAEIGQETPAATNTIRKMLGYLFKSWRNKKTQTATTFSLYNDDAATVDQKATTSDDGTTGTVGEITTGP